jgi:four helix bundle protein
MNISSFEELEIWKESRELTKQIRIITRKPDFASDYRFCSQINSSAGSVMDNIAEGFERDGAKEFIQFLFIAKASNAETRSQAYRAFDASFITKDELENILQKTSSLKNKIFKLITYLKNSDYKGNKYK